jgi:hypothetical protein
MVAPGRTGTVDDQAEFGPKRYYAQVAFSSHSMTLPLAGRYDEALSTLGKDLHGPTVVAADIGEMDSGRFDRSCVHLCFNYDTAIPGLEVIDRYTLKIHLTSPDLRVLYVLAVPSTAAVAREVVEAYGNDIGAHPVGTGPFTLGQYKRSTRIELLKNPKYREKFYVPSGPIPEASQPIAATLRGKRLPLLGRVDISILEETQARWLAFLNREADILFAVPPQFTDQAVSGGKLKPRLAAAGLSISRSCCPTYVTSDSTWRTSYSSSSGRKMLTISLDGNRMVCGCQNGDWTSTPKRRARTPRRSRSISD